MRAPWGGSSGSSRRSWRGWPGTPSPRQTQPAAGVETPSESVWWPSDSRLLTQNVFTFELKLSIIILSSGNMSLQNANTFKLQNCKLDLCKKRYQKHQHYFEDKNKSDAPLTCPGEQLRSLIDSVPELHEDWGRRKKAENHRGGVHLTIVS